jgi:hypothetical protein
MFHLNIHVDAGGCTSWMGLPASRPAVFVGALLRFAEGRWRGGGAGISGATFRDAAHI